MAQDFAKQRTPISVTRKPVRAATKAVPSAPGTHWSWYFSGLMSGVILAIAGYLGLEKLEADAALSTQVSQNTESPVELPTFNFGFYNDLANAEVAVAAGPVIKEADTSAQTGAQVVPPLQVAPETVTEVPAAVAAAEDSQVRYRLQAGSFQNRQDAENQRARITLLNMDVNVVPGVVSGRTHHRVQVGPFAGRRSADAARDILAENNIESIPLLMR